MATFPPSAVILFVAATAFQLLGVAMLPATKGMTVLLPSLLVLCGYGIGVPCMARLIVSGVNLSLLIPIITLTIILGSVGVGVMVYGDPASPPKILLLLVAAAAIGLASRF